MTTTNVVDTRSTETMERIEELRNNLPKFFTRQTISREFGGMLSPKTLAALDSNNQGPEVRVAIGKRVGYERESFLRWLKNRMEVTTKEESSEGK